MFRMPIWVLWLSACSLLVGCTSSARPAAAEETSASAGGEEPNAGDPLVCERRQIPGRRIRKRVCRRQSEIDRERAGAQTGMHQVRPEPPPAPTPGL